ncbi:MULTISPECIES: hypothetical protein [unclassified Lysobacter]|uniref:hypothetical protein n=1 Tax=unclassified Lysobacter TaxID=2635362 RepID=UPI001BED375F|nr:MULTISPECIES: hypothetical protein [unclassified Lysobacter]MBT2745548.1 hypothetical protein [Lysobacter sp. ISL-42]MBT2753487.1 hypothetical protein [Lysobacter sp. ISL-50]MBT2777129.1 hypothetical protein [Lysobacter sp. ISL-54]MBT2780245.1 hypothetical protein [Lysobacter sp. ISL-52]
MRLRLRLLNSVLSTGLFTFSFVLAAPSAHASDGPTQEHVTLVRLKPDPNAVSLTARLEGRLQIRNGCVYLISKKSKLPVLTVWPSTYRLLSPKSVATGVIDTLTGKSLKFGVNAVFGGGGTRSLPTDILETPAPAGCDGEIAFVEFPD